MFPSSCAVWASAHTNTHRVPISRAWWGERVWICRILHSSVLPVLAAAGLVSRSIRAYLPVKLESLSTPARPSSPAHATPTPYSLLSISLCVQQSREQAVVNAESGWRSRAHASCITPLSFSLSLNACNQTLIDLGLEHPGPPLSSDSSHLSLLLLSTNNCLCCIEYIICQVYFADDCWFGKLIWWAFMYFGRAWGVHFILWKGICSCWVCTVLFRSVLLCIFHIYSWEQHSWTMLFNFGFWELPSGQSLSLSLSLNFLQPPKTLKVVGLDALLKGKRRRFLR